MKWFAGHTRESVCRPFGRFEMPIFDRFDRGIVEITVSARVDHRDLASRAIGLDQDFELDITLFMPAQGTRWILRWRIAQALYARNRRRNFVRTRLRFGTRC